MYVSEWKDSWFWKEKINGKESREEGNQEEGRSEEDGQEETRQKEGRQEEIGRARLPEWWAVVTKKVI